MADKKTQSPQDQPLDIQASAVRELAKVLQDTGLTEIEYESQKCRIRVVKENAPVNTMQTIAAAPVAMPAPAAAPAAPAPAAAEPSPAVEDADAMKAPMVGTVYLAPQPGAAPFVKEGDHVNVGDTLLIIEAMKVMNPIKAPKAGTLKKLLVSDAEPVEYDQPLLVIA